MQRWFKAISATALVLAVASLACNIAAEKDSGLTPEKLVAALLQRGEPAPQPPDICRGLGIPSDGKQIPTKNIEKSDMPGRHAALIMDNGKPYGLLLISFSSSMGDGDIAMDNWGFLATLKGQLVRATHVYGPSRKPKVVAIPKPTAEISKKYRQLIVDLAGSRYVKEELRY